MEFNSGPRYRGAGTSQYVQFQRTSHRETPKVARPCDENAGRIPKDLLYGELVEGYRKTGRPKLRFKDSKRDMIKCSIDPNTWECQAEDRSAWRVAVRQGTTCAEAERNETAAQKRARRKQSSQQPSAFKCPNCGRDCHSRIGLHSHSRWCSQTNL